MTAIEGSRVLITGGANGIGRGLAEALAARGAEVVIWDLRRDDVDAAVAALREAGGRAEGQVCDVSDRDAVYAAAETLRRQWGPVHILVNNAGVVTGRTLLECPDAMIEKTMGVNAMASFWTVKAFLPDMLAADRGHVVTIASAAGLLGVNRLVDYCASKHAAVGFDDALRNELRVRGSAVRTTVVCPYFVKSRLFAGARTRYAFLLPLLEQDDVVAKVVKAIEKNRTRVVMPRLVGLSHLARLLPTAWFDGIMSALGVHASMDEFGHGRGDGATVGAGGAEQARQPGDGDPGGADRPAPPS
ncbi:MAG: SDR family oxidoreductase [Myxococcota bacterium]